MQNQINKKHQNFFLFLFRIYRFFFVFFFKKKGSMIKEIPTVRNEKERKRKKNKKEKKRQKEN